MKCNHIYSIRKNYRKCLFCGRKIEDKRKEKDYKLDDILRELNYLDKSI